MQSKLDIRLTAVAERVLPGETAADIGSDHMHLPVYLVNREICPLVIATDKAQAPCVNGRSLINALGMSGQIDIRCGDGLQVLQPGEAATIILTGMGGRLIKAILDACPDVLDSARRLVLSPQKDPAELRLFLADRGWCIIDEQMIFNAGIYYTVITAEHGDMTLDADEALYGPCLLKEAPRVFTEYLRRQLTQVERLRDELAASPGANSSARLAELFAEKEHISAILHNLIHKDSN